MGSKSNIEWTATTNADGSVTKGATWNPIRAIARNKDFERDKTGWHCVKVSPGCVNCYAERMNVRLGTGLEYKRQIHSHETFLNESILTAPLRWRKPRKIFVCSMTDLFGEWVLDRWLDQIFMIMAASRRHVFQILTKRPERMRRYVSSLGHEPPFYEAAPHIWLGVSCEDQQRLDERYIELLKTPAAVRFVSAEPLLGPLDFRWGGMSLPDYAPHRPLPQLDWVIVGGESGPGARPMDVAWVRDIVRQCRKAGTACFVKQLGAKPYDSVAAWKMNERRTISVETAEKLGGFYRNGKWSDPSEWPPDLRVREFPEARS